MTEKRVPAPVIRSRYTADEEKLLDTETIKPTLANPQMEQLMQEVQDLRQKLSIAESVAASQLQQDEHQKSNEQISVFISPLTSLYFSNHALERYCGKAD